MKTYIPIYLVLYIALVINSCASTNSSSSNAITLQHDNSSLPKSIGYVNDFENILSIQEEEELTAILHKHEELTSNQIAIVTVKSIGSYTNLESYSLELANYWGVGQKDENNGILIAFGKGLREIRIQNGEGITEKLTDSETQDIINTNILPKFKEDNYFEGIKAGLEAIIKALE